MPKSAEIVVGIASSPETHLVLEAARTFAERLGAKLHLVHASGLPIGAPFDVLAHPSAAFAEAAFAEADAFMKRVRAELDPDELAGVTVVSDAPWRSICDVAERVQASLIVVGAHDPRVSDVLLGTTAAKVASRAKTRVLVVRRRAQASTDALAFHRVLVALDGSPHAPRVLDTAVRVVADAHARLTLLRVVTPPVGPFARFAGTAPGSLEEELKAQARAELDRLRAQVPRDLAAELEVSVGVPWQGITETAARMGADLVVLGSHGYDAIDLVLGTTAAKVVNHTDRSVLIAR
jgi:universal stress protein F